MAHDYARNGTTSLFAAFDTAVPRGLDLHLICDSYATQTPEVKKWLLRHPRFHLHFTLTRASWINDSGH